MRSSTSFGFLPRLYASSRANRPNSMQRVFTELFTSKKDERTPLFLIAYLKSSGTLLPLESARCQLLFNCNDHILVFLVN